MFLVGIKPDQVWPSTEQPPYALGTLAADNAGRLYRMVKGDGTGITGPGYSAVIAAGNIASMASTTTTAPGANAGMPVGIGMAAIAANGFGWLAVYGSAVPTRVAANAAKGTVLNSTATAGQLDDDATAGAEVINGIGLEAANGGAAGLVAASLTFPHVSRTL